MVPFFLLQFVLDLESCDVNKTIAESITLVENQAREYGITIRNDNADSHYVIAQHDRLKHVVINLLTNAIK